MASGQWAVVSGQRSFLGRRPSVVNVVASETTRVWMDALSEQDISDYIATREPLDKAGAYAIQGRASRWIPRIEGCYFNVVGLPVPLVSRMLRERRVI